MILAYKIGMYSTTGHKLYFAIETSEDQPSFKDPADPCLGGGFEVKDGDLVWCWHYMSGKSSCTWAIEFLLIHVWHPDMSQEKLREVMFEMVPKLYEKFGLEPPSSEVLVEQCSHMQI